MKIFILLIIILSSGCTYSQQSDELINEIDAKLTNGKTSLSSVLSDTALMFLHSKTAFRDVIKKHAKAEGITILSNTEPGKKILVKGKIETSDGKPVTDALVYVYQTSDKGWYSDTAAHILQNEGDMQHARLFGYLKTNDKGEFEYNTIQPKGYPNSDLPAHSYCCLER